jgi:hypothetical protein
LNKAGKIEIPALEVNWFNTVSQQQERATLPARSFMVEDAVSSKTSSENTKPEPLPAPVISKNPAQSLTPSQSQPQTQSPSQTQAQTQTGFAFKWIALVFALLWVFTLFLWWQWPRLFIKKREKKAKEGLKKACLNNQPELAKTALLAWGRETWPEENILDLSDLLRLAAENENLLTEINALIHALYSLKSRHWQGEALYRSVMTYTKKKHSKKKKETLLPSSNPL